MRGIVKRAADGRWTSLGDGRYPVGMKVPWPFVAVLIAALVAVGSLVPQSNASMDLSMAAAAMADMDMPDCDGCEGGAGSEASAICDSPCTTLVAMAGPPVEVPTPVAASDRHFGRDARLFGMTGPPDTAPPRSRDQA